MEDKSIFRKRILQRRSILDEKEVIDKSRCIFNNIIRVNGFDKAAIILCYVDYNNEAMTREIILYAIANGKKLAVPKVSGKEMDFYYITSLDELAVGYHGILEPVTDRIVNAKEASESVMILPGSSFDKSFNRNGYGGGYYDRYLDENPCSCLIGLAFELQIFDEIPHELHDKTMDYIVSEEKIYSKL